MKYFLAFSLFIITSLSAFILMPIEIFAQSPSVSSFTAAPLTINSGQPVSFVWNLQNAGGYSFLIPCIAGVTVKYQNGGILPCDSRVSSMLATTDSLTVFMTNVSGATKPVTARIIPKNAAGQDYDAEGRDIRIWVSTHPQPITSVTTSATTTTPGESTTLSWSSQDLNGMNLSFECKDEIRLSSSSYAQTMFMPCGVPVFPTDFPASGSVNLIFSNASRMALPLRVTLLPAFAPKQYDGTHAAYIDFTVASDILPDPVITLFAASSTTIASGEAVNIMWAGDKSKGANLQLSCASGLTATSSKNPAITLSCDTLAFSDGLNPTGTLSLLFRNTNQFKQTATLTLLPSKKAGEYDLTRGKGITFTVHPAVASVSTSVTAAATTSPISAATTMPPLAPASPVMPSPAPSPASVQSPQPTQTPVSPFLFKRGLSVGSRGNDVMALQEFLKRDRALYPEGLVTGYFGPATERAIKRFQGKHGIARAGTPGYGFVGPKTRAKLNTK